jgi:hypothetical protein
VRRGRSYISRKSAEEIGLKIERLKNVFEVGLGGRVRRIDEWCFVQGNIKDNPFHLISWVVEELGQDEKGKEIELLFGATEYAGLEYPHRFRKRETRSFKI